MDFIDKGEIMKKQSKILAFEKSTFTSRADGQVVVGLKALLSYATKHLQQGGSVKLSLHEGHLVVAWYCYHEVEFAERFRIS
jgi:hypothetical protein